VQIPEWPVFLATIAAEGGTIAIILLDLLIHFAPDSMDAEIEKMKPYLALIFSAIVPQVVALVAQNYPTVNPWAWAIAFAVGSYGVHELLFRLVQKPVEALRARLSK
jgi:hypothetical protein